MYVIEGLMDYQRKKYYERQQKSLRLTAEHRRLTPFATQQQETIAKEASRRLVTMCESRHPVYRGTVSLSRRNPGTVEVSVNMELFTSRCNCLYYDEHGTICQHVRALLQTIDLCYDETKWNHRRYHMDTYTESYAATVPALATAGKLDIDKYFAPPDHKRGTGHPKKKRIDNVPRKTNVRRKCPACGYFGHMAKNCSQPNTEYRFYMHSTMAIKWCQKMLSESIVEE
jgi:SWIM zinc finger